MRSPPALPPSRCGGAECSGSSGQRYATYTLSHPLLTASNVPPPCARGFPLEALDFHCRPDVGPALLGIAGGAAARGASGGGHGSIAAPARPAPAAAAAELFRGCADNASDEACLAQFNSAMWTFRSAINVRTPLPSPPSAALRLLRVPPSEGARLPVSPLLALRRTEAEAAARAKRPYAAAPLLRAWEVVAPAVTKWCIAELSARLRAPGE